MQENGADRQQPRVITVSTVTIVKIAAFAAAAGFVYLIRDVLALFFASLILASIINPLASWFQSKKMSRSLAVLLLYAAILTLIGAVLTLLVPAVLFELRDFATNSSALWEQMLSAFGPLRDFVVSHGLGDDVRQAISKVSESATGSVSGIFATIGGFLSGLASLVIVLVVAFYLVVSEDALRRLFHAVAPEPYQPYLVDLFQRIEKSIGGWVRGQLILSLAIGVLSYVAFKVLGVEYALLLALLAGVAEVVPYIGPILSAIPAILIALTDSPLKGLLVAAACLAIQQAENHVLAPKIMQRVTGLHPVVSIFSVLIGLKVAGLVGALFAIPVAMMLGIVIGDGFRFLKSSR